VLVLGSKGTEDIMDRHADDNKNKTSYRDVRMISA